MNISRRSVVSVGGAAAITTVAGGVAASQAAAEDVPSGRAPSSVKATYDRVTAEAGGEWWSYITKTQPDGTVTPLVEDQIDQVVSIYSVNKIAVAAAVWDKIDRGELSLDQKITLTSDIILSGEGFYYLQTVYGDQLTLANVMTALLLVSDNTAVRLCGSVCSGPEINAFLERKGFTHTRVQPLATNPNRFFLGNSTPREMHTLLTMLVNNQLVSERGSRFILGVMLGFSGVHDGVRHNMSSQERARVATKFGAFSDGRHEAGIIFDAAGAPALTYVICAKGQAGADNFGATHPAVKARAKLGRAMLRAVDEQAPAATRSRVRLRTYRGSNGG